MSDRDLRAAIEAELNSEDAHAVLFGVTGTNPESYGGVTKDEALECAGELLTRLRTILATQPTTSGLCPCGQSGCSDEGAAR